MKAEVYITPASGVGGEFPIPVPFRAPYTKKFVRAYAAACRALGQKTRIVWSKHESKTHS